jgi:hypothetical protein
MSKGHFLCVMAQEAYDIAYIHLVDIHVMARKC